MRAMEKEAIKRWAQSECIECKEGVVAVSVWQSIESGSGTVVRFERGDGMVFSDFMWDDGHGMRSDVKMKEDLRHHIEGMSAKTPGLETRYPVRE